MYDFRMNRNDMPNPGEVWSYYTNAGLKKFVLIIKSHGTFSTALNLIDDNSENSVEICEINSLMRYTDPRMLQYIYNNNLDRLIYEMKEQKFAEIMNDIASALDISRDEKKEQLMLQDCIDDMLGVFGQKAVENYCMCRYFYHVYNNNKDSAAKYMRTLAQIAEKEL